jgi:RNA polymerase sigma-70 factor (ECF subfamily)
MSSLNRGRSKATGAVVVRLLPAAVTDEALVKSLRAQEPGANELLFERYGAYVQRLVVRAVGLDEDVPDLIHEVFARVLEGVRGLRESSALKGWIGSVALFTVRAYLRQRQTRRRWLFLFAPSELPERAAPVALPEVTQALVQTYKALDSLPPQERIVFALRFIDGMELGEIAEISEVSLSTVKRRLSHAQKLFARAAERDPMLREQLAEFERERA